MISNDFNPDMSPVRIYARRPVAFKYALAVPFSHVGYEEYTRVDDETPYTPYGGQSDDNRDRISLVFYTRGKKQDRQDISEDSSQDSEYSEDSEDSSEGKSKPSFTNSGPITSKLFIFPFCRYGSGGISRFRVHKQVSYSTFRTYNCSITEAT